MDVVRDRDRDSDRYYKQCGFGYSVGFVAVVQGELEIRCGSVLSDWKPQYDSLWGNMGAVSFGPQKHERDRDAGGS